jgi:hypothetical protein
LKIYYYEHFEYDINKIYKEQNKINLKDIVIDKNKNKMKGFDINSNVEIEKKDKKDKNSKDNLNNLKNLNIRVK